MIEQLKKLFKNKLHPKMTYCCMGSPVGSRPSPETNLLYSVPVSVLLFTRFKMLSDIPYVEFKNHMIGSDNVPAKLPCLSSFHQITGIFSRVHFS